MTETFAFACGNCKICGKRIAMMDVEFEYVCAMIDEGSYDPAEISTVLDNMFYEKFGMSCSDVVRAISMH